jgi:hypothetical protein
MWRVLFSGRFARDRLMRLGLPLVAFTFVLWPPAQYTMQRLSGLPDATLWRAFTALDPAQLWFLEVRLLFSLGYAALCAIRRRAVRGRIPVPPTDRPLTITRLLAVSAAVAAGSYVLRGWFPPSSDRPLGLHLCQWAQYVALYGLGLAAARRGWLDPVPDRLRRACGIATVVGSLAIAGFALAVAGSGEPTEHFLGGWNPAAAATAAGSVPDGLPEQQDGGASGMGFRVEDE